MSLVQEYFRLVTEVVDFKVNVYDKDTAEIHNQKVKRMREIAMENAIFAFVVKALLIFLSMVGYCNLWFAIFIDMAAAMATILNSIRVTQDSIINILLYKTGKK